MSMLDPFPIRTKMCVMCGHFDTRQRNDCARQQIASSQRQQRLQNTTSVSDDRHNNKPANRERHAQLIPVYKHATRLCVSNGLQRAKPREPKLCVRIVRVCAMYNITTFQCLYALKYARTIVALSFLLALCLSVCLCVCVRERVSHSLSWWHIIAVDNHLYMYTM